MRVPGLTERRGRLLGQLGPTTLLGHCWLRGAVGAPTCHPLGPGRWGLRGGSSKKFHTIAHSRHRTYPEAKRDASSLRLQGLGGIGGAPATQQQPRLRAIAGVRGPCARRAARRSTLHKGSMALPRLAGSPGAAAALPCPGRQGLAPFHPTSPPLLLLPPHCSQAGQLGAIESPAPSSAAVAAAARTVTLAAFAAIYIHTIGFHSWNQGLVCLCAEALVAKVPRL